MLLGLLLGTACFSFLPFAACETCKTVPALGRIAKFGDVYDARTNKFTNANVLKRKLNETFIDGVDNPNTKYTYSFASRESQMLEDFDIHGEIKVQICTGVLNIKGAGKYATNSNYNTKVVQYNQILKTTTRKETFNWKYIEDKDYDLLRAEKQGTHMVVGIQYGGNAVITLKRKVTNESSVQEVRGNLSVALQGSKIPFVSGGEAGASLENVKKNNKCFQHAKISIEADIVSGKNGDISSIEGVKQFMDTFGGELMKYNDKKGIQVSYDMVPINIVSEYFNITYDQSANYEPLPDDYKSFLNNLMSQIEELVENFYGVYYELEENKIYFARNEQKWWKKQHIHLDNSVSSIHDKINNALAKYHENKTDGYNFIANKLDTRDLKRFVNHFKQKTLSNLLFKLDYIKNAEVNSVRFINNLREFEKMKRVHKDFYVCILPSENFTDYQQVLDKFVESAKDKTATKHFLLNIDVFPKGGGEEFGFQKTEKYPYYRYKNDEYVKIWDTFEGYKLPTFVNMSIGFSRPECTCARNSRRYTWGCTELYEILLYQNSTVPAKNTTKFCAEWQNLYTGYKVELYHGYNTDNYKSKNHFLTDLRFNMAGSDSYYQEVEITAEMDKNAKLEVKITQNHKILAARYIQYYIHKKAYLHRVYQTAEEMRDAEWNSQLAFS
jgi:hypothetical protein